MIFKVSLTVIFILLNSIEFNFSVQIDRLKALIVIHRNGDRTPLTTYPNDTFNVHKFWFEGAGQLTDRGKERMYRLGQFIAERYSSLVTENAREVYARSSAMDRCLESAQLLLAGMYPPKGKWIWNQDLLWQPIAVKSKDYNIDSMLNPTIRCPNADAELKRIHSLHEYKNFSNQFKDLFTNLTENTGIKVDNIKSVTQLQDILEIQQKKGWKLNDWITESMLKILKSIADRSLYFDYSTKLLQKFRTGVLMRKIRDILQEVATDGKESESKTEDYLRDIDDVNKKIFIFTGHAETIVGVLTALDVFNGLKPPFGAAIFIEVTTLNTIRLFYLNETDFKTPIKLQLYDCDYEELCDLKTFKKAIERVISYDWRRECGAHHGQECAQSGFQTFAIILIVLAAIGIAAAVVIYIRSQKKPTPKDV